MKNYLVIIGVLLLSFPSYAQLGEFVGKAPTPSPGMYFRQFNDSIALVHDRDGQYFLLNGNTGDLTSLEMDNAVAERGFTWVQHIRPDQYLVSTSFSYHFGTTKIYLFNADGTQRVLDLPGNETDTHEWGKEIYYSKMYHDGTSFFMIKGSPLLRYYNRVRFDDDFNPISEDTLINSATMPDYMGYPYYGAYNGEYFVFSGRNGYWDTLPVCTAHSIHMETLEIEDILQSEDEEFLLVGNIVQHGGWFYFNRTEWASNGDRGIHRSNGKYKGTENLFYSPRHQAGGGFQKWPLMPPIDKEGRIYFNYSPNGILDRCSHDMAVFNEFGDRFDYSTEITFPINNEILFSRDSVVWLIDSDECSPMGQQVRMLWEYNLFNGEKTRIDSIKDPYLGIELNLDWAIIKSDGGAKLFEKSTRKISVFENVNEIGVHIAASYMPNPYYNVDDFACVLGDYIYYSIGEKIYRQILPKPSGINVNLEATDIDFFPNPVNRGVIQLITPFSQGEYTWYSSNGQWLNQGVISKKNTQLKTPISSGLFILKITDKHGQMFHKKVVVE